MTAKHIGKLTKQQLHNAMKNESSLFEEYYVWIEQNMPASFFKEMDSANIMLITHNLMGFPLQEYFTQIHFQGGAIVLCLDSPDADLIILKNFNLYGIKNYQTFISTSPPPFPEISSKLRIALLGFTETEGIDDKGISALTKLEQADIYKSLSTRNPDISKKQYQELLQNINAQFTRSLKPNQLVLALDVFFRSLTRDHCQYEVIYKKNTKSKHTPHSLQIILAWRNTPKHRFLYRLAKVVYRHKLSMKMVHATYIKPYSKDSVLIMSMSLHRSPSNPAWEKSDIEDFLSELVTLKYFNDLDRIETVFVDSGLLRGNLGNFLRSTLEFVHQVLVHVDLNMYAPVHIEEALCRHPELTVLIARAFELKFHPDRLNLTAYQELKTTFFSLVQKLDTGHKGNDMRRKNVLQQAMNFIDFCLKTNFYRANKSSLCYRLNPNYLQYTPTETKEKFKTIPYAIFFVQGMHFIAFHVGFKEIARGGLRTIFLQRIEHVFSEKNNVFAECYNLAYTQQKKNKDIPEGGAKAVIFLEPYTQLQSEAYIYEKELIANRMNPKVIEERIAKFNKEQITESLYAAQRSFIHALLTLVNFDENGELRAKRVVDYWKRPEYIYLGPDENMHNEMIEWIANYSIRTGYIVGKAFISSKPKIGINHKEYGVTSLGVNTYMHEVLLYLGINPQKDSFTIKISGGPDGDVAGNQIRNLYNYYPKTAKLVALTDVSGTIFDPEGLDLSIMLRLFKESKPIRFYPAASLNNGGYLLDVQEKKEASAYSTQTLLYKKEKNGLQKHWISGNEMNHLLRNSLHKAKADVFIPAGGRPRTLHEKNWSDFLDNHGSPTSKIIIEGANLYLTTEARDALEKLGVLIVKDSSANKCGVICSSFEVLSNFILSDDEFLREKKVLMKQILHILVMKARMEAELLLRTYAETQMPITKISDQVSERINEYTYQILESLEHETLSSNIDNPFVQCLIAYCPPLFQEKYRTRICDQIPDLHKKAIIACYIASRVVYKKGLKWRPTIVDILPILSLDPMVLPLSLGSNHKIEILK